MNNDFLEQIQKDIELLLTFVPARRPEDVEKGLAPMFYVTGTYEGDKKLATQVADICERYGIAEEDYGEEDFADAE